MKTWCLSAIAVLGMGCGSSSGSGESPPSEPVEDTAAPDTAQPPTELNGPEACPDGVLTIFPESPTTTESLEAIITESDASYGVTWFLLGDTGNLSTVATGTTLLPVKTRKERVFVAEATPLLSPGCAPLTAQVTIANTPPSLTDVMLTPTAATVGQTLTCAVPVQAWSDVDETDPIAPLFTWRVGEEVVPGAVSETLSQGFAKGDAVRCRITPFDGDDEGDAIESDAVTIVNAAPEALDVSLSCDSEGQPLLCTAQGADADADAVSLLFEWVQGAGDCADGAAVQTDGPGPEGFSEFDGVPSKGSQIRCCVTPSDEEGLGGATVSSAACTVGNHPPSIDTVVVEAEGGGSVFHGSTVSCTAEVSDYDGDPVALSCSWFLNGESAGGDDCLLTGAFAKGDSLCCQVSADDGSVTVTASSKVCQTVADTPPVLVDMTLTPEDGAHCVPFECSGSAEDADGDSVDLLVSWTLEGELYAGVPTPAPGQEVGCTVTPVASGLSGQPLSLSVVATNEIPVLEDVELVTDQDPPGVDTVLTCTPKGWSDADACDASDGSFSWYVNGELLPDEDGNVLTEGQYSKQSIVLCVATPGDGWEEGVPKQSGVLVVKNSAPVVDSVVVSPIVGQDSTEFSCEAEGSDPDGDGLAWVYTWFVDDELDATLSGPNVSNVSFEGIEASLSCLAQPLDAETPGEAVHSSNAALLYNVPPVVSEVSLSPLEPDTLDTLHCTATVSDPDEENVTPMYEWSRVVADGFEIIEGQTGAVLPPTMTNHFDSITCRVTPWDGKVEGAPQLSNTVQIANTIPSIQNVTLYPQEGTPQTTFTCLVIGYFDPDNDPSTLVYTWSISEAVIETAVQATFQPSVYGAESGDVLSCTAQPMDDFEPGDELESGTLTLIDCSTADDGTICDDENPCSDQDQCLLGQCLGVPTDCDDGNVCTNDDCDVATGCVYVSVAEGSDCDDGEQCTVGDACHGGSCVADGLFDCDDANVCTADVCVPGVGCEYSPQSGECEGGLCVEGVCCVPNCTEKDCGGDGCGGTCGACEDEELCLDPPGRCFADLTDAMVAIAPGTFTMGCEPALDPNCKGDEKPAHTVTLSPYWIDAVEVTVARYQECVEAESCTPAHSNLGGCLGNTEKLEYPVNCIEWDQAADYCAFVEKRLCTEAEWEKAARGTEMRTFPWGEQPASCAYAVMKEVLLGCGLNGPGPIASVLEASSPYGVLDMAGNVSEWVGDYYSSAYYLGSPASDPKGPSVGATRSHRGGSFISTSVGLRTSARNYLQPDGYGTDVGFRCCQDY